MNLDFPHQVPQAHPTTSLHLTSNFSFLKSHQVQGQMELWEKSLFVFPSHRPVSAVLAGAVSLQSL